MEFEPVVDSNPEPASPALLPSDREWYAFEHIPEGYHELLEYMKETSFDYVTELNARASAVGFTSLYRFMEIAYDIPDKPPKVFQGNYPVRPVWNLTGWWGMKLDYPLQHPAFITPFKDKRLVATKSGQLALVFSGGFAPLHVRCRIRQPATRHGSLQGTQQEPPVIRLLESAPAMLLHHAVDPLSVQTPEDLEKVRESWDENIQYSLDNYWNQAEAAIRARPNSL